MKIHFLGTGNASNMSAKGHQSILCQTKDSHFFVDFGPTALLNSFRFNLNINEISHLFLTHFHGDHSGGIPYLLLYHRDILQRQTPFYFYGPAGIEKYLRNLIEANYPGTEFPFELIFEEIAPEQEKYFMNNKLEVKAIAVDHRPESVGYRFNYSGQTLAISGDTRFGPFMYELAKGAELFISECSLFEEISDKAHISPETVKSKFTTLDARQIALIHSDAATIKKLKQLDLEKMVYPEDGDYLEI
ncbi:MAG: ribonuclease Z [Deltaproteobacteria bacterium]|nr:ribonuclease Z [Deltaproteobacteria bacterium]